MTILLSANHSTQFLAKDLRRSLPDAIIKEAEYDSIVPTLLDAVDQNVWVMIDTLNLRSQFHSLQSGERVDFGQLWSEQLTTAVHQSLQAGCTIWITLPPTSTRGLLHGRMRTDQFEHHLHSIREQLNQLAKEAAKVHLLDLNPIVMSQGLAGTYDPKLRTMADQPYCLSFTRLLAQKMAELHQVSAGKIHKCCILDLDHTLWGGVIGDDGVDGITIGRDGIGKVYREIQLWARELRRRGIILAICSKNTEAVAREPFSIHPDMILREEDIAVFVANWDDKASNIRHIQEVLNIGFDSMVFIDDNPMERAIVREQLPEVTVPELPEAPEDYLPFLESLQLFETLSKDSGISMDRTRQYRIEAERVQEKKKSKSLDDFLANLDMTAKVDSPFQHKDFPRISELFQRSNQFNLTTIRYSEGDVAEISTDSRRLSFSFRLKDKFGEHGIVSLVVARLESSDMIIEAWVMSCRVLKRSMEHFVLNTLLEAAQQHFCTQLIGQYLPTPKNALVANLYPELGFTLEGGLYVLDTTKNPLHTHVSKS